MDPGDGRRMMQYLLASPLKHHTMSVSVDEDVTKNDFLDEVRRYVGKEKAAPLIKLQKKGTMEIVTLAISEVETWDNLLRVLQRHFPFSNVEPQITSFDGSLISSPEDYKANLKPGLHLMVYFPPTVDDLSQSLDTLFFENMSSTSSAFKLSSNPYFVSVTPTPDLSQLAGYGNSPSPTSKPSNKPIRYHLQPPSIYFTVSAPTPISITLSHSTFKNVANKPSEKYKHYNYTGSSVGYLTTGNQDPTISPSLSENYHGAAPGFKNSSTNYLKGSYPPTKPSGTKILASCGPLPMHDNVNQAEGLQKDGVKSSPYRAVSGGIFSMTSFDLFAQTQRKRVMCSIEWDVLACPMGGLKDIVSEKTMPNISWAVMDGESGWIGYNRSSEKRVYANYEGPVNPEDDNSDGRDVGWWMVGPGKLPTGFTEEAGEHTFLLNSVAEVATHLRVFMRVCGISEDVIEGFTNYWTQNLELPEPAVRIASHGNSRTNAYPSYNRISVNTPKLILLKFLHPRDLRTLLPLSITPEPHRVVRLFAVFRVIEQQELAVERISPCGDFETEIGKVLGGIGSCGGGWDCGHQGFRVAEVGGVRVFGNSIDWRADCMA